AQRRDADPKTDGALANRPESPPEMAVVECDGGRIRTPEPGHGPGVHRDGEGWGEAKKACLIRAPPTASDPDPPPEPPEWFADPKHVAQLAETQALSVASARPTEMAKAPTTVGSKPAAKAPTANPDWRPKRLVRTVLSSIANSKTFGKQMEREAKRRRFGEAKIKGFLGGGLPWNWSLQKAHFKDFTPILDFIHALGYLFVAAKAIQKADEDAWDQYLVWMRGAWQGEIAQVLEELRQWQTKYGEPSADAPEQDPRVILATTTTYLENNQDRMK